MAIAEAEPKKGDRDVTSTGSSSGSNMMESLPNSSSPVKYSSLKEFSFSVPDVWSDVNIRIFLDCCHAHIDDLKNHNGSEENKVWEKIAKTGLEKCGSLNCFNVNYCLELAKCLKIFVSKNEKKMMDNEIFKLLYRDVVGLLPYFAPISQTRLRSRSKSVDNTKCDDTFGMGKSPESTKVVKMIAKTLKKFNISDLNKTRSREAIWQEVSAQVEKQFGIDVNPLVFLEGYKRSVITLVRKEPDPHLRTKMFLDQVDDLLPFFDLIPPKTIKKAEFLPPSKDDPVTTLTTGKRKSKETAGELPQIAVDVEETPTPTAHSTSDSIPPASTDVPESFKPPPKKRGRKPKTANPQGVANIIEPTRPTGMHTRRTTRLNNAKSPRTENSGTSIPEESEISSLKEVAVRSVPAIIEMMKPPSIVAIQSKNLNVATIQSSKPPGTPVDSDSIADSDDSEIEDVPLIGTNIRVHNVKNTRKLTKLNSEMIGNGSYPVVLLDKLSAESFMESSLRMQGRAPLRKSVTSRITKPTRTRTLVPSTAQPKERRKPGRPPKVTKASPPTTTDIVASSYNRLLVSSNMKLGLRKTSSDLSVSRALVPCPVYEPPVLSDPVIIPQQSTVGYDPGTQPPHWFSKFVSDTRRHEMWKMHQLLRMQQELVNVENQKHRVLDKILTLLDDTFDR